jgi:hypothetical protein
MMIELIAVFALVVSMCALRALLSALKLVEHTVKAVGRGPQDEQRNYGRRDQRAGGAQLLTLKDG